VIWLDTVVAALKATSRVSKAQCVCIYWLRACELAWGACASHTPVYVC
jgi:hypothetical protein